MTGPAVKKYTTSTAASAEVDRRAEGHMAAHGGTYREAWHAVLAADPDLRTAYGQPSPRVARMAATDPRSKPVAPVTSADEREIREWVLRALEDGMEGLLPSALGSLAIETSRLRKQGMTGEESYERAASLFPHLVAGARALIADLRRNKNTPVAEEAQAPGDIVCLRVKALMEKHPELDYRAAMGTVLSADQKLKVAYART